MSDTLNPPGQESFNEVLIKTVRQYPPLYMNNRRAYDTVDRSLLWEEVARKIGRQVTPEFAKKRWLQLRDRYRKELKIAIAQGFTQPHRWSHFPLLKWLDPYLQGSLSVTVREYQDGFNGIEDSFGASDTYCVTNNSLLSFANNLFNTVPEKTERFDSCDSEVLDDVKPSISTMQSVLAAAEASAKAAAAASKNSMMDDLSPCPDFKEVLDQMTKDAIEKLNSNYPVIEIDEETCATDPTSSENSITSSTKTFLSNRHGEQEEKAVSNIQKICRCNSINIKGLRNNRRLNPRLLRIRSHKRFKSSKAYSGCDRPFEERPEKSSVPACINCTSTLMSSWFDDEEMLFARIIGLRLKKMSAAKRKATRLRISQILDDEEAQVNEYSETGTSVAE